MVQVVEAPDIVRNKVSFSVFGLEGAVSLKGRPQAVLCLRFWPFGHI